MDCPKDQQRSTLRSGIWFIPACRISWSIYLDTNKLRMFFLEGELRGLNLSSRAISVAQWPGFTKSTSSVCNVSLWFLRLSESLSLSLRTAQWWVGGHNFRIFVVGRRIAHRIEPILIFALYLLTLNISPSLSQVGSLSCSVAGRGYKQRMWSVSLWFLRLPNLFDSMAMMRCGFQTDIKPMNMKEKFLVGFLLMVDLLFLWQVFVGIVRVYTVAFAFLVTIAETEWEPIFKFWRVCVTAESYFS